jgi:hypothetical protein
MGMRDKRLAQRKVANESNSGMPQRDILPTPLAQVWSRGARRQTLAYTIHLDDITAARMRVRPQERRRRNSALLRHAIVWIYST